MRGEIWSALGLCSVILGACGAGQSRRQLAVDEPFPVLDSTLQESLARDWMDITARQDRVFGCVYGAIQGSHGPSSVRAVRVELTPISVGECKGGDAIGAVWFFGPKPNNAIGYTLELANEQQRLFCLHPTWLVVGAAYDTSQLRLRTTWIVRTAAADAFCSNAGNREAVFDSREIPIPLQQK
jgi:hypothetical protein